MLISIVRAALLLFLLGFSATGFAAAPAASTQPASGITSSSVVLNGVGLPNGQATTGYFRYSATDPGSCSDTFGTRVPTAGGTDLGSGTTSVPYSITATGLSQGVTYYFCAIVTNAAGTALGSIQSFTIPYKPVVVTVGSTNVTSSSATLQGTANPVAAATTAWFRYSASNPGICDDSFGTRAPSSSSTNVGSGITPVAYTQNIGSLLPGVTYYFCAIANNSYGTTFGTIQSFTAPAMAPSVTTGGASNLTRTTGQLSGYANPGGDATKAWFRLGTASPGTCNDTFGRRSPSTGGITLGAGTSSAPFSQNIATLTQGTTYYYCALASNSLGTSWGAVQSFTTPSPPTAVSVSASSISNTAATLNGVGNPNRAASTGWFRYAPSDPGACDDKFGSRAPVTGGVSLGSDAYDQPFAVNLTGLSPATTYYYCAVVSSSEGVAFGALKTFTTASPPLAATVAASSVGSTSATMNGLGTPNGATANAWFRYSNTDPGVCNDSFGSRLPSSTSINIGAGPTAVPFAQSVSSLQPGTKYYYCALVYNGYGTSFGELLTFTTTAMAATVNTGGVGTVTRSTATLTAYGNPGGDATIGWFRYSTVSPGSCNDSFGTRAPTMSGTSLGAGSGSVSFSQAITGLSPATTYYYCALASNSSGTVFGSVQSFITPSTPTVSTAVATNITTSSATINGLGNPNRASAIGWFRYSSTDPGTCDDKFGSRVPLSSGSSLGNDIYDQSFAQSITGLSGGATYYYCAIVSSSEGIAYGRILSFTTSGIPAAVTNAATSISANSAMLNGAGGPNGASASGWFRYSTVSPVTSRPVDKFALDFRFFVTGKRGSVGCDAAS